SLSPDARSVAVVRPYDNVLVWDVHSGEELPRCHLPFGEGIVVSSVAYSSTGRTLAVGTRSGGVSLWEAVTARKIASLDGHLGAVPAIAFSPRGRHFVTGSEDSTLIVWDAFAEGGGGDVAAAALSDSQIAALWEELRDQDPARAYAALNALRRSPAQFVA